ncbi:uncharacterized protein N7496_004309 [Penicillium cataractarum]|uniref:Transcription factor domain-containing protein n=1 Tax=Penicillium cataractarum TaxID=2100454 RepID=A0A9W9VJN8_9EURO|nr:uncharacterized protein N7496_004309 [Penicillium cataractarum]KAJ5381881.1 hypothetical protein N7496_004309 [Penicillium cataractarum]
MAPSLKLIWMVSQMFQDPKYYANFAGVNIPEMMLFDDTIGAVLNFDARLVQRQTLLVAGARHRLGTQQQVINNSTGVLVNSRAKSAQRVGVRTRRDRDKKVSLPFLLNYSATSDRHPGDVNHVLTQLASTEGNEGAKDTSLPSLHLDGEKNGFFAEDSWNLFFETFQDAETQQIVPLPLGLDDQERRSLAAERILQCILETTAANPGLGEDLDIERAQEFFQEENILSSILAYFDNTVRPRCRIVLKSTFNLDLTSPGLLLSMILMGAICGMSEDIKLKSVEYLDMAEFAVFESQCFHDLVHGIRQGESVSLPRKSVEIIQAAILVILLQISSPNPTARRRIRIQRYPALVSAARTTGLTKVKNQWHDSSILNYEQFIRNEICIRLEEPLNCQSHRSLQRITDMGTE